MPCSLGPIAVRKQARPRATLLETSALHNSALQHSQHAHVGGWRNRVVVVVGVGVSPGKPGSTHCCWGRRRDGTGPRGSRKPPSSCMLGGESPTPSICEYVEASYALQKASAASGGERSCSLCAPFQSG